MAVSSVSGSSNASSIYGNRNIITGLASGMDTEAMIENSVAGLKTKIQSLIQQQTKLTWKQDAFRGITDRLIALSQKYTSYTSKTNFTSPSYFANSYITSAEGKYKDKVSASGKTSSDVRVNAVKQLASSARYSKDVSELGLDIGGLVGGKIDWKNKVNVSDMSGSMTLTYGNRNISLDFGETESVSSAAELAALIRSKLEGQAISTSTGDTVKASERIGVSVGSDGTISFSDTSGAGNSVYISSVSGNLRKNTGLEITTGTNSDKAGRSFRVTDAGKLSHEAGMAEYLSGKTLSVTLDGVTKTITIGELDGTKDNPTQQLAESIQSGLKDAFGSKVTVTADQGKLQFEATYSGSTLKISSEHGAALGLGKSGVANYLDTGRTLGELFSGKTAEQLKEMGLEKNTAMQGSGKISVMKDEKGNEVLDTKGRKIYLDENGYRVWGGDGDNKYDRLDDNGRVMYGYKLTINGEDVGVFNDDSALESVFVAINSSKAGVKVNYSQMTNKLTVETKETGADQKIDFGKGLGEALFGKEEQNVDESGAWRDGNGNAIYAGHDDENGIDYYIMQDEDGKYFRADKDGNKIRIKGKYFEIKKEEITDEMREQARKGYTKGKDAMLNVTVNGENMDVVRAGNVINMDGLSVTLKGTFNEVYNIQNGKFGVPELNEKGEYIKDDDGKIKYKEVSADDTVTFSTKADSDKLVEDIKGFVEAFNDIMKTVHDGFATMPAEKNTTKHTKYEPLTDDDKEGMTDKAIEEYEEKAKQGILFADSDVSQLYNRLRSAITPGGSLRKAMESIGLTTNYEDGVTTLALDEDKLRQALEDNPDRVKEVFSDSKAGGAKTDGIMAGLKKTLDAYASNSYGNYGILVRKAGTKTSSLSLMDNTVQKQIDSLDKQIDRWQEKMSDQIDYYTRQFTALEQLMMQMNSQSSALMGLMGGGSSY